MSSHQWIESCTKTCYHSSIRLVRVNRVLALVPHRLILMCAWFSVWSKLLYFLSESVRIIDIPPCKFLKTCLKLFVGFPEHTSEFVRLSLDFLFASARLFHQFCRFYYIIYSQRLWYGEEVNNLDVFYWIPQRLPSLIERYHLRNARSQFSRLRWDLSRSNLPNPYKTVFSKYLLLENVLRITVSAGQSGPWK